MSLRSLTRCSAATDALLMTDDGRFQWLRRIRRMWILQLETFAQVLAALSLPVGLVFVVLGLGLTSLRRWAGPVTVTMFGVAFLLALVQHALFYRALLCPNCGHNPNRYKNGNNVPVKTAWKRLEPLTACPQCGT
jgi:hypothetical protein